MKRTVSNIPQLPLLHHNHRVNFISKTMQQIDAEENDQLHQPHRHDYYSIIWVVRASGVHHIDFKSYPVKNQTIYFISPGQVHHLQLKSKPEGYVFLFTPDFLEASGIPQSFLSSLELFFACDEVKPIRPGLRETEEITLYAEQILTEFNGEQYLKQETIATWLKLFLICCRRIQAKSDRPSNPLLSRGSKIVRDFKLALELNYHRFHKVHEYARILHLSSNYLNEVIKEETGKSVKDFIQDRILLEAKRLAAHADISLKEASSTLGFDDPAHFSKFFINCSKISFTAFREQIRKNYL